MADTKKNLADIEKQSRDISYPAFFIPIDRDSQNEGW